MGDGLLAGIAGAAQGTAEGLKAGQDYNTGTINQAVGIQNLQNAQQTGAIKQEEFKKSQAEEARLNAPVYMKDVMKKVPKEFQKAFTDSISDKIQGSNSPDGAFISARDLKEHKETLDNFGKHEMLNQGISFLSEENKKVEPKLQKNTQTLTDLMKEFQTKSEDLKAKGETSKLLKFQNDWKERLQSGDIGEMMKETQGLKKQVDENQKKIGMYRGNLNGAEESVKKIIEAHPSINPDDIMGAWGGDKEKRDIVNEQITQDNEEKKKAAGISALQDKGVTEKGGFTVSYRKQDGQSIVTKPDGTQEVYNPETHGKILSTTVSQTTIYANDKKEAVSFNTWTPEAKAQEFTEHMITGQIPVNVRGIGGTDRQAYAKEFAQWKVDNKFTPQQVAVMKADYKAQDLTLRNMTKQEAPMRAFVQNINAQVDAVDGIYETLQRTDVRALDLPIRELKMRVKGSGSEKALDLFMQEISAESIKLSQGSSASIAQIPEGARKDWIKIHDSSLSLKEIIPVLKATKKMANMRMSTWEASKEGVKKSIANMALDQSNFGEADGKPNGKMSDANLEKGRNKLNDKSYSVTATSTPQEIMDKMGVPEKQAKSLYQEAKTLWIKKAKGLNPSMSGDELLAQWKNKGGQ